MVSELKENSMVSTYMSKNCSTPFVMRHKSSRLPYANRPMPKDVAHWNQSASTWRHTTKRYSFSRQSRFPETKFLDSPMIQPQLGSTNNNKTCTFGKGGKKAISEVVLRNAQEKPAPNAYRLDRTTSSLAHGRSFGISWKGYERSYIQHRKDVYSEHFSQDYPPAKYNVQETPGKKQRASLIHSRLKMYTQKMAETTKANPGPCYLFRDRQLHNMTGLNDRSFGFGSIMDLGAPANDYPAAIYNVPGFTHKFKETQKKNLPPNQRDPEIV